MCFLPVKATKVSAVQRPDSESFTKTSSRECGERDDASPFSPKDSLQEIEGIIEIDISTVRIRGLTWKRT